MKYLVGLLGALFILGAPFEPSLGMALLDIAVGAILWCIVGIMSWWGNR